MSSARGPRIKDKFRNLLRPLSRSRSRVTLRNGDKSSNAGSLYGDAIRPSSESTPIVETMDSTGTSLDFEDRVRSSSGIVWKPLKAVLKHLERCLDGTPFKTPISVLNTLIAVADAVIDNQESIRYLVIRTRDRLEMLDAALHKTECDVARDRIERFARDLVERVAELDMMSKRGLVLRMLTSDDDVGKVKNIFNQLDECAKDFHIDVSLSIERQTAAIHESLQKLNFTSWPRSRQAVYNADLDLTTLTRESCTPGTRTTILTTILNWAKDPSSPAVYWLHGMAGTGKSTIAYSICQQIEESQGSTLAASFFCSQQIEDTRRRRYLIATIVYQLARRSPSYSKALLRADIDAVDVSSRQMKELLVDPWDTSAPHRRSDLSPRLVVIDALDENDGGSEFLKELLDFVGKDCLQGLKFLVTSRGDPRIVAQCQGFREDAVCQLQLNTEDVQADILTFLQAKLPAICSEPELQGLAQQAGGLFIYAATSVRFISPQYSHTPKEQKDRLSALLESWPTLSESVETMLIDQLYGQILLAVFTRLGERVRRARLAILHTILCSEEPVSAPVVSALLPDFAVDEDRVGCVVDDLHAVLYISKVDGCIYWYHKSFFDFMYDPQRSTFKSSDSTGEPSTIDLTCKPSSHHAVLAHACFCIMKTTLRFNICNLPSSFLLDSEVVTLDARTKDNIPLSLRYGSRQWARHLVQGDPINAEILYPELEEFCNTKLLFWIEVMNLIGAKGCCYAILLSVKRWVGMDPNRRSLVDYIGDAAKLATIFAGSPASLSTPHLYLSSLASFRRESTLYRKWGSKFRGVPSLLLTDRTSLLSSLFMTVSTGVPVTCVAFSPKGSHIISGLNDHTIRVWDAQADTQLLTLIGHTGSVNSVSFSPDASRIVSGSFDRTVRLWDAENGIGLRILNGHRDAVESVAFSPVSDLKIVSGSRDNTLRLWDAGGEIMVLCGHKGPVTSVDFSPDGVHIVSGALDSTVRVWDVESGTQLNTLDAHTPFVTSVAFSSDGSRIVFGLGNNTARVWDAQEGTELITLSGHNDCVSAVKFSPDGSCIVTGSYDHTVRVWNAEGVELRTLNGHKDRITSAVFSPDGSRIVSGSRDTTVCVWDAETSVESRIYGGVDETGDRIHSMVDSPEDFGGIVSGSHNTPLRPVAGSTSFIDLPAQTPGSWTVDRDGWIVSPSLNSAKLMWLPSLLRDSLYHPSMSLIVSPKDSVHLDFTSAYLGTDWALCYIVPTL